VVPVVVVLVVVAVEDDAYSRYAMMKSAGSWPTFVISRW